MSWFQLMILVQASTIFLKYARDARWDVVGRAMEVLEASVCQEDE